MTLHYFILKLFLIIVPLYIANASAMIFKGKMRLDLEKNFFDGKPLLGKGKTLQGTFFGVFLGMLSSTIIFIVLGNATTILTKNYLFLGMLLSSGAIVGDITASFFKRRIGKKAGEQMPLLDQLDFVFGGIFFALPLYIITVKELIVIIFLTLVMHKIANFLAFKIKLKKVPW
jgi:CDP-2,3-bis-(O-geranylgeranyl)-sn-glycerol synthase